MSETSHTATVNLNDTSAQVVYTHEGPADFTPTRVLVTRHSGMMPAEGGTRALHFGDTGPATLRLEVTLAELDEPGAVVQRFIGRSAKLSMGQQVRVRPDAAYGEEVYVSVTVFGV